MNTTSYTGTYFGIAGVIVMILTHFGVNATIDQIVAAIGAIVTIYGLIHQAIVHKNLAQSVQ